MPRVKTPLLVCVLVLTFAGCGSGGTEGDSGGSADSTPPPADSTPPSAPTGFMASPSGQSVINLSWSSSSDNTGVTGYRIERCQGAGCSSFIQVATAAGTSLADAPLIAATTYSYRVRATDAAGNFSLYSTVASATTAAAPPSSDTTPPTAPGNLVATAVGEGQIDLTWGASTDNVGVAGYSLERCQGVGCASFSAIAATSGSPYSDTASLLPSTTYRYRVRAIDAAGNVSVFSSIAFATTQAGTGVTLPVGALAHDGPATPEQISLVLPVTGSLPQTATATVRYRQTGSQQWITGHPLFRVQPAFSEFPQAGGAVQDVFAWPIIDAAPGTSYDIEVTVTSGATTNVKTLTHTTRALPDQAGAVTTTISAGSTTTQIQAALSNASPGNVVQFQDGTYDLTAALQINRSGTPTNPIYIRGTTRTGTVLRRTTGSILAMAASHVIVENMTLQGVGTDGGRSSPHTGISLSTAGHSRITVRHMRILGVDRGVDWILEARETLVYDNTLVGNNLWILTPVNFLETGLTWDDEGIKLPGAGNVAFNNTLSRFGDSFAYAGHISGATTDNIAIHYYRNDVRNSGDDLVEVDHGRRNLTWYDNRSHNSMTCDSLDPLYGGPWLSARNICINPYRVNIHKWNSNNSGQFLYNNTIIGTISRGLFDPDKASWYQPNNGAQRAYGYRNNIHVYRGNGGSIQLESTIHSPIDWTHNSWYPNRQIQWGGVFSNLANAQANLGNTTPIFSGTSRRMQNDNITVSNPWTTTITLGFDSVTEVTASYTPVLSPGDAAKNSGVVIPNITDGFSGGAPDRGAIIEGRTPPVYGDRTVP